MAFKVSARIVLELGSELISSDFVAIYELAKNSVDAESEWVSITMQVVIKKSIFQEALEGINEKKNNLADVRKNLFAHMEKGAPDSAKREFKKLILEAGDNPDNFEKALRIAYERQNWIEVRDAGHGMTAEELENIFLVIGTRSRRSEKINEQGKFMDPGRTVLGDKGVGRLAAMRLGDRMTVTTSHEGEIHQNMLDIDWQRFSHESVDKIEDIKIHSKRGARKEYRSSKGTTILIRNLRGDWDQSIFKRMVEKQFKRIIDPFPSARSKSGWRDPDQLLRLCFNGTTQRIPELPEWLLEQAHAVVTARYDMEEDGAPRLRGEIEYKLRGREKQFALDEAELMSISDPIADRVIRMGPEILRKLGSFSVTFYWYNRRLLQAVPNISNRRNVLDMVNSWAGGIMVFRDFFRINPYGGQDDDWLELDKKALSASGYKVNRSQIIGQVSLSSRNFRLIEKTDREGLVDNQYKQVLVGILRHIIITGFRGFIDSVDEEHKVSDETTTDDLEQRIKETNSRIEVEILSLMRDVPEQKKVLVKLHRLTINLGHSVDKARAMAKEYEDDRAKFVYLAGIGLMVEFILHEIGRIAASALDAMESIDKSQLDATSSANFFTLEDQLSSLKTRVDAFDPLSASRRQVKGWCDVADLTRQVIDGRAKQFFRHGIKVSINLQSPNRPYKIKAVKGMFLQILENLFENSVYWLEVEKRRRKRFKPQIELILDAGEMEVIFRDNGPGIARERAEEIFEPFVTSKPPGQGKGLGLYIARETARYHDWELSLSLDNLNGNKRSTTFLLEMNT